MSETTSTYAIRSLRSELKWLEDAVRANEVSGCFCTSCSCVQIFHHQHNGEDGDSVSCIVCGHELEETENDEPF